MKAQKFSEEIVNVSVIPDFDYLLGTNRDGLVTLLSREDASIQYPHLFGIGFEEFNDSFFYFKDKNNLEFLVEFSTGKIVTLDNFKSLFKDNHNIIYSKELEKVRKFYIERWVALNDEYYIYTNLSTQLKSLVKKDTLEPKLEYFSKINCGFSDNNDIVTILQKNGRQKLYNLKTNSFFEMNEYLIINPIFKTPFILIGDNKNELRLYRIKGGREIEAVFDDASLYVNENDIIKLKNGKILINLNNEVYMA